jgi:hypothetical protein
MPKVAEFRGSYAQEIPRLLLCRERFLSNLLPFFTLEYGHTDEQFGGWFPCASRLERLKVESEVLTEKLSSMFHMDFLVGASALIKVLGG